MGKLLHFAILKMVVPFGVMLDPILSKRSLIISPMIIIAVTLMLRIVFHKKLRDIDMIEALSAKE